MLFVYLVTAIIFHYAAHFLRVSRWQLFLEVYETPRKDNLMKALSIGYLFNYFMPYKLGDVFRILFSGRKMKNGTAHLRSQALLWIDTLMSLL